MYSTADEISLGFYTHSYSALINVLEERVNRKESFTSMPHPVQLIDILSKRTAVEHIWCDACDGSGQLTIFDSETGTDVIACESCLGSGYNQLGMILQGILQPPAEGYGPVELRKAISVYLEQTEQQLILQDAQQQILEAEETIAKTQQLIEKTKALIEERQKALSVKIPTPNAMPQRRIS